jgi:hypothetical protein
MTTPLDAESRPREPLTNGALRYVTPIGLLLLGALCGWLVQIGTSAQLFYPRIDQVGNAIGASATMVDGLKSFLLHVLAFRAALLLFTILACAVFVVKMRGGWLVRFCVPIAAFVMAVGPIVFARQIV